MKNLCFGIALFTFLISCSDQPEKKVNTDNAVQDVAQINSTPTSKITSVGSSGFSIDLPANFKIDSTIGDHSSVYYFQPTDTNAIHGEAGIYIGKRPQQQDPNGDFSKREFSQVWMGQMVKWTEYSMNPNTQRETFVELNDSMKIHCWCYSDRTDDLEKLFNMVNTINH